jgi:hypothetical protein
MGRELPAAVGYLPWVAREVLLYLTTEPSELTINSLTINSPTNQQLGRTPTMPSLNFSRTPLQRNSSHFFTLDIYTFHKRENRCSTLDLSLKP